MGVITGKHLKQTGFAWPIWTSDLPMLIFVKRKVKLFKYGSLIEAHEPIFKLN